MINRIKKHRIYKNKALHAQHYRRCCTLSPWFCPVCLNQNETSSSHFLSLGYVLSMFLRFGQFLASCSYKKSSRDNKKKEYTRSQVSSCVPALADFPLTEHKQISPGMWMRGQYRRTIFQCSWLPNLVSPRGCFIWFIWFITSAS